jgi:L-cysteine/cystine lyase
MLMPLLTSSGDPSDRSVDIPALANVVYLNTGSAGPLLRSVADVLTASVTHELERGRADNSSWRAFLDSRMDLRVALADLVGADAEEIALTHHTTEGLDIALWGIDWAPGDHIAITSLEHDAGIAAVHTLADRFGLIVEVARCGLGGVEETLAAIDRVLAQRPRMLLVSHVAYATGAVLPIAEIAERAHAVGALVLVDGAQAVGAIDVDVHALGVDAYSFNGYKWLCGPEGSGALVVRSHLHDVLLPSYGGAFGVDASALVIGDPVTTPPLPGAARYESGSWFRPQLRALEAAIAWFQAQTAGGGGARHVSAIAEYAAHRLETELGALIHTPTGPQRSGLVAFSLPERDPRAVVAQLEAVGVIIRSVPGSGHLRLSCAAFTTEEDITALIAALSAARGPAPADRP